MKMVFKNLLILICCAHASCELVSQNFMDEQWKDFKQIHKKAYTKQEESKRRSIWQENIDIITKHNIEADNGLHSFRLEINKFTDMTIDELKCNLTYNELGEQSMTYVSTFLPPNNLKLPDTVDWRNEGYVTHVKDQRDCGSCWAFSTTGGLEGQHFKKTGKLVSLSEQNLIDCSTENNGCNGGRMDLAYQYIVDNNGINTEESYPYVAEEKTCTFNRSKVGANCTGFVRVTSNDELALQKAVAYEGPIAVGIHMPSTFHMYKNGVYDIKTCDSNELNHGVLVVGYGVENGKDYWLVKNSYGPSWGMNGYFKISRNNQNQCGIATFALYPTVPSMQSSDCSFAQEKLRLVAFLFLIYHVIA